MNVRSDIAATQLICLKRVYLRLLHCFGRLSSAAFMSLSSHHQQYLRATQPNSRVTDSRRRHSRGDPPIDKPTTTDNQILETRAPSENNTQRHSRALSPASSDQHEDDRWPKHQRLSRLIGVRLEDDR